MDDAALDEHEPEQKELHRQTKVLQQLIKNIKHLAIGLGPTMKLTCRQKGVFQFEGSGSLFGLPAFCPKN